MAAAQDIISLKFAHEIIMNRPVLQDPGDLPQNRYSYCVHFFTLWH